MALPTAGALLLAGLFALSIRGSETTEDEVTNSYEARLSVDNLLVDLINAETGGRGYALTHDTAYLEPYHLGMQALTDDLGTLESRVDPDRYQTQHVLRLRTLVQQRVNYFVAVIDATRTGLEDLIAQADGRMYEEKRQRKGA